MAFQPPPKRPPSSPSNQAVRPPGTSQPPSAPGSLRPPGNLRDAKGEAHALGGGAVGRVVTSAAKKTIVIVNPDADFRSRLRALLEGQYNVMEAKDGMDAVDLAGKIDNPGMFVSDTQMPRVDGFTLAKILRQNPVLKKVPIMFVSAQHSPQHVTQALVIGVSQYLPKTTPVGQIAEKIRKIVI